MSVTDVPRPALATLSHERFWADGWVYERKLDGQRCLAVRTGRGTRLYSRSGRDVTVAFPEIAEALEQQASTDFVVDGGVVAFEGSRTSFERLTRLERDTSPCTRGKLPSVGVHWARPELVAEVAFTEWTTAGQLRHPRYLGLRTDKRAEEVVRE